MMPTSTIDIAGFEKLDPPTSIGGLVAEVAEVTRFYYEDVDTGKRTEYGTPIINVIWGKTATAQIAALEAKKLAVAQDAALQVAELTKQAEDLAKPSSTDPVLEVVAKLFI